MKLTFCDTQFDIIDNIMTKQCQYLARKTSKYLTEAEQYNKQCNKQLNKQVFSVFIYSCKTSLKKYCRANSKISSTFTKSAACYNQNKAIEMKVYTSITDEILGATNAQDNKKIPHLCWYCSIDLLYFMRFNVEFTPGQ